MLTELQRRQWDEALMLPGDTDLHASMVRELCEYTQLTAQEVEVLCSEAATRTAEAWRKQPRTSDHVERFYDEYPEYIFRFAPLGTLYLRSDLCFDALAAMRRHGGSALLDYGSGIGTMALFFHAQGVHVTLADISTPLLRFCQWRFGRRRWSATFLDLKKESLGQAAYDFIIAFDVFEHLRQPWQHLRMLEKALRPGGLFFIYSPFGTDEHDPLHIVRDTRVLDLAPMLGLQTLNCSPYRLFTRSGFFVFRAGQTWGISRVLAIIMGWIRYGLKRLKNGPQLIQH